MDGFSVPADDDADPSAPQGHVDESRAVPAWLQDAEVSSADPESHPPFENIPDFQEVPELPPDDSRFEDSPFEIESLPDFSDISAEAAPDDLQEDNDLATTELPGWLAAMRPVESAPTTDEEFGEPESSGPLAGLNNVLAAHPDILRLKKPPVYSSKLQISESQKTHASLLQEMLESEHKPQPLPLPHQISSHRLFRGALGAILVIVAFLAVLANTRIIAMPSPVPPSVMQTSRMINALNANETVLLAFDYEPGFAGEMEAVTAAVVDHIMLQGAKLAVVSTSPTGPALAERFIHTVQGEHNYVSGSQYVNLGYIPGGVPGLAAFARQPQWVTPNTIDGIPAWGTGPIQNVSRISDFALIVIVSDTPETVQAWIEQVQPQSDGTPMIAVVSAQVAPMIRPYYEAETGQLSGLISGLPDAASYEVVGRNNLARDYWDAFNIILIVAVSAILVGTLIITGSELLARRKEGGKSA